MRENRSFAGRHPRLHHHNHSLRYFSLSLSLCTPSLRLSVSGTTHVCLARQNKCSRAVRDGTADFNAKRSIIARYTQICRVAAYRRVYDSRRLQADCKEPGSEPEPYRRQSSMG